MRIEIAGHTDFIGSNQYNNQLSVTRASSVVDFLINKGIAPTRLETKGYGKTRPIASNDDELDGRELNRRVEFKILRQ
jgi:outer membrane protein OmpA-like peptidoglycan-associated protein